MIKTVLITSFLTASPGLVSINEINVNIKEEMQQSTTEVAAGNKYHRKRILVIPATDEYAGRKIKKRGQGLVIS